MSVLAWDAAGTDSSSTEWAPIKCASPRAVPRMSSASKRTADRPHTSVVAVEKRLGEGADDDRLAHVVACPRPVVPPQHVAGPQPVLGGAAVGLDPVHEVEPVPLRAGVAGDAFDRLHEATAEARVDIRFTPQRLHRRHARGHGGRHQHLGAAVARHP